jgi:hypothetical protein
VTIPVKHDPLNKEGEIEWRVKPTVEDKAIRVQDIMLIDIIRANDWNRPIYFSTTVMKDTKSVWIIFLPRKDWLRGYARTKEKSLPKKFTAT